MNPFRRISRALGRAGVAALEFGLILPVLVVMFIATAEAVSYLRVWYRLEQAAASAAQAASRTEVLNSAAVAGFFEAARSVADPYTAWNTGASGARARTVISAVSNPTNGNVLAWSCSRGDSTLTPNVAGRANLPTGFSVPRGQSVLVVEIINATSPWRIMASPLFFGSEGPAPLRTYAIVRPRAAELSTLTGGCP